MGFSRFKPLLASGNPRTPDNTELISEAAQRDAPIPEDTLDGSALDQNILRRELVSLGPGLRERARKGFVPWAEAGTAPNGSHDSLPASGFMCFDEFVIT